MAELGIKHGTLCPGDSYVTPEPSGRAIHVYIGRGANERKFHIHDITHAQEHRASIHKRVTHTLAIISLVL